MQREKGRECENGNIQQTRLKEKKDVFLKKGDCFHQGAGLVMSWDPLSHPDAVTQLSRVFQSSQS